MLFKNLLGSFISNMTLYLPTAPKDNLLHRSQYTVIHDNQDLHSLECELETALETGYLLIVIEPMGLGDRAIRWIRVGNFLHKCAVLSSVGVLGVGPFLSPKLSLYSVVPVGVFGVLCACVYDLSWQYDPCCKYQVDYHGQELTTVPSQELESTSAVVLVQRNDKYRRILHNTLAVIVTGVVCYKVFKYFY